MQLNNYKNIIRWVLLAFSFLVVVLILWNTYDFFQKFKHEERQRMQLLGQAYERFNSAGLDEDITLSSKIISGNTTIPMIVTNVQDSILLNQNLDTVKAKNIKFLKSQLAIMKAENKPIEISYQKGTVNFKRFVYYRDTDLLTKLKYYPLALIFILLLFGIISYLVFISSKISDQNKLWVGMAKETAHQIGTPLTSLLGWITLLKEKNIDKQTVNELEKDVDRLSVIAHRFSNIGSIPKLDRTSLIPEIDNIVNYFKTRLSNKIALKWNYQNNEHIYVNLNSQLFSWVLENLIKNAVDAINKQGTIKIIVINSSKKVIITVSDTGKGIPARKFKTIFKPGYSTKKRGWGLGLSLAKRIIENYHKGKIYVQKSEPKKETNIRIELPLFKG